MEETIVNNAREHAIKSETEYHARWLINNRMSNGLELCPFRLEMKSESLDGGMLGDRITLDFVEDKRFPLTEEIAKNTADFVRSFLMKVVHEKRMSGAR